MRVLVPIREALSEPTLLGGALPGDSWRPWRVLLIACMGEALDDEERAIFKAFTGREREPGQRVEEFWGIVGRRGGKTRAAGTLAAYIATLADHSDTLAPGERGVLPVLAQSTRQATKAFQHICSVLQLSPVLACKIQGEPTSDTLRLTTGIDIEVRPANFRTIRSITAVAAVCDEISFWNIEGAANPDAEVLAALRPCLATTQGPLICISSPYAKKGEVYETYKTYFKPDGDPLVLVAKASSKAFNSTLSQRVIDRAYERDPAAASAEYGGEFRSDIEALLTPEAIEAVTSAGVFERPPQAGTSYFAFVDPSGGSSDSMTLAIAHRGEDDRAILDAIRVRKAPYSPDAVVKEFAATIKEYGLSEVTGDNYGGEFCKEPFRKQGIRYNRSERFKSAIYLEFVPIVNSGQVDLLEHKQLNSELISLERRTARGGRESIDHADGKHDDIANAVAGAVVCLGAARKPLIISDAVLERARTRFTGLRA